MDRTHKEVKKERNGRGETVRTFSAEHSFVKVRVFWTFIWNLAVNIISSSFDRVDLASDI